MFQRKDNDNVPLIKNYLVAIQHVSSLVLTSLSFQSSSADLSCLFPSQLDIAEVNDAYNELLIEEEQVPTLRDSILNVSLPSRFIFVFERNLTALLPFSQFSNFDSMALARRLEAHELLEFRRLAVVLYNKNRKWEESISLSKKDKLFQDAILTAAESGEEEVAEEVLTYFVDIGSKECFAATLFLW